MARLTNPFAGERASLLELGAIDGRDARNLAFVGTSLASVVGITLLAVLDAAHSHVPGLNAAGVLVVVILVIVIMTVMWRLRELPLATLGPLTLVAVGVLAVLAYEAGAVAFPFVAVYFVWIGALFPFFSRRQSGLLLLLAVVVCAIVIGAQPGHWDPLIEWMLFVGTLSVTAFVFEFLMQEATVVALDERRSRQRLEAATAELAVVNQQKREFLASVSHELRTPLNAVIGFADVLAARFFGALNERQADYVDDIRSSGRHLLELIGDVFDVRKVESGALELEVGPVDMNDVVSAAVGLFRAQADARRITLRCVGRSKETIEGDERKLRQVVMNLIANAVEFTPPGGEIVVQVVERAEHVSVAVRSTT